MTGLDPNTLIAAGATTLGVVVTISAALWRLAVRLGNTEANLAAEQARHAEAISRQVAPISNGFAASVKASLDRIELAQAAQVARMDRHLEQHANANTGDAA